MKLRSTNRAKLKRLCQLSRISRELFFLTSFLLQHPSSQSIRRKARDAINRYAYLFPPGSTRN